MIREVFVIRKDDRYYAIIDLRPVFSANKEDAETFDTYKEAVTFLSETNWFSEGFYQLERWYVIVKE